MIRRLDRIKRSGPGAPPGRVPSPAVGLFFLVTVAALFSGPGGVLQRWWGELGHLAAEWLFMALPAVLLVRMGRFDPVAALSLRRPGARALGGATLLLVGALPAAWTIGWLQSFVLPVEAEVLQGLERLATADSLPRLAWLLLLLAVTPAFCEELVFRGVLLGSTRTVRPWMTILLNGLVFGSFHLSVETVARFLPTAWLGIVLAWTVWRTGSIFTGVLMHLLNNGIIVLLASTPAAGELMAGPGTGPPFWSTPLAALCLVTGFRVVSGLPEGTSDPQPEPIHHDGL